MVDPAALTALLQSRLAAALTTVLGEPASAAVTPAADLRFGDYQSNAAMVLAKQRKTNPRALAQEIIGKLELEGLATADIAGPGFINFRILPEAFIDLEGHALAAQLRY